MSLTNSYVVDEKELYKKLYENHLHKKLYEISTTIGDGFHESLVISKGSFNIKIINIDKIPSLENRAVYIFHLKIIIGAEYIENNSKVHFIEKKFLTSKIVDTNDTDSNYDYTDAKSYVLYGSINVFEGSIYCNLAVLLTLGEIPIC